MPSGTRRRGTALASATLLAALGCASCSLTTGSGHPSCSWTNANPGSTSGASSSTVVLVDTSASYWPRKGTSESLPDNPGDAVSTLFRNFGGSGTQLVSLGTFNGSSTTISWLLTDTPLPVPAGTAGAIKRERNDDSRCVTAMLNRADQTTSQVPGTDIVSALDAAGSMVGATASDRKVVLVTDGLSNTGCLDLNKVLRQGQSASDVVQSCSGQGGLKQLAGVSVQLDGIGYQALGKPLQTGQQNWLVNYWRDLCSALKVSAPQSCVSSSDSKRRVRVSDSDRASDPRISFPKVHGTKVVVPSPLLFAFNSSTLTQTAQSYLNLLVQQIRSSGRQVEQVIGHTDRVGTAAYNLGLSRRRAQAVRSYLSEQGFSGIRASGVGFSQPACPQEYYPSGRPNKSCMAKDRRVEIILGGSR